MKQCLLIVEDNSANRELLSDWLEIEGFEVVSAENLEQARVALKTNELHAVLLDVQLGADDGLTLAAWIRSDPALRDIPVIAVTAHAMLTDQERVLRAGCNASISKPISFPLLREQLDRWLGQPAYMPPSP
jgi:two-component system, cell cycle response regulator DivK